jgi:FtsZ-interacting cell division protein YlmF
MDEIVKHLLASGTLTAVLFLLLWSWFSKRLETSIEHEYKTKQEEAQKETQKELARLNAELQRLTSEHTFRFSHVFQKTEEAIATIYKHLVDIHELVRIYHLPTRTYSEAEMKDYRLRMSDAVTAFQTYWYPHKIYLRKNIAKRIVDFTNVVSNLQISHEMSTMLEAEHPKNKKHLDDMVKQCFTLKQQSEELLSELEDEFQEVLGFPIDRKPQGH